MKKLSVFSFILVVSFLAACITTPQTVWIDVRTVAEYEEDHIFNTLNIPHVDIGEQIAGLNISKTTPIKLFCRSGRRSAIALETLTALGYTNLENVGGIADARLVYEE